MRKVGEAHEVERKRGQCSLCRGPFCKEERENWQIIAIFAGRNNAKIMSVQKKLCVLLSATLFSLSAWAQAQVQYKEMVRELGDLHWKVPVEVKFHLLNVGQTPLIIEEVKPDCGCTQATWQQQPIAVGEQSVITALFDAQTLGTFEKQVLVKTNANAAPQCLKFRGRVVAEVKDIARDFPYKIGNLHLSTDNVEFDDVQRGEFQERVIYVHNGTKHNYMPHLLHLPKYLNAYAEPEVLRPGRVGRLRLSLNSNELHNMGLTQTSVYLARFSGDRVGKATEIGVSATLLPPHATTATGLSLAPEVSVDTLIDLGSFEKKSKLKGTLILKNTGHSSLEVSALQVYNPAIRVQLNKRRVAPGEQAKMKIEASADLELFKGSWRILLITNDPRRPKLTINVQAKK